MQRKKNKIGADKLHETIIKVCSEVYGSMVKNIAEIDQDRKTADMRAVAMYFLKKEHLEMTSEKISLAKVGSYFNRDHTTVLHAINKVNALLSSKGNADFKRRFEVMEKKLNHILHGGPEPKVEAQLEVEAQPGVNLNTLKSSLEHIKSGNLRRQYDYLKGKRGLTIEQREELRIIELKLCREFLEHRIQQDIKDIGFIDDKITFHNSFSDKKVKAMYSFSNAFIAKRTTNKNNFDDGLQSNR